MEILQKKEKQSAYNKWGENSSFKYILTIQLNLWNNYYLFTN